MKEKVSVIIAAYNEEPRIAKVLTVVENDPLVDEVIVVNDGSSDKTAEVVKRFEVTLIENEKNLGKTLSVKKGIAKAKNEVVLLLDADIVGLTTKKEFGVSFALGFSIIAGLTFGLMNILNIGLAIAVAISLLFILIIGIFIFLIYLIKPKQVEQIDAELEKYDEEI